MMRNILTGLFLALVLIAPQTSAATTYAHTANWAGPHTGEAFLNIDGHYVALGPTGGSAVFDYKNTKACIGDWVRVETISSDGAVSGKQTNRVATLWTVDAFTVYGVASGTWPITSNEYLISDTFTLNIEGPISVAAAIAIAHDYITDEGDLARVLDLLQQTTGDLTAGYSGSGSAAGWWNFKATDC